MNRLIFIVLIGCSSVSFAQAKRLYKVYSFGNHGGRTNDCARETDKRFGFRTVHAGCIVTLRKSLHNKRIARKLDKRNGTGWREVYKLQRKECLPVPEG